MRNSGETIKRPGEIVREKEVGLLLQAHFFFISVKVDSAEIRTMPLK